MKQMLLKLIMIKIIILTLFIPLIYAACATQCLTCSQPDNPYACLSCSPDNYCPTSQDGLEPYIIITAIITSLHIFMIIMGQGVYRDIFENIQLVSLVNWRYGFEGGSLAVQGTNLAVVKNNSFPDTFGTQFIAVMVILGIFWLLLLLVDRIPHNPTAILIRRKKIILPTRIITFIYNILLFSSLIQITTTKTEQRLKAFALSLAILALFKILVVLIGLAVTSNWKRFQVDDPHYYVLLQQMTTKKWYAKNNILIGLLARGFIIITFVIQFDNPQIAGIIMVIIQIGYTLYVIALLRYVKIRYYIFIVLGNLLSIAILLVIYIGGISTLGNQSWQKQKMGYVILLLIQIGIFFFATTSQLVIKKQIIVKQLKSIYYRFIKCEKLQQNVIGSKYDEKMHREKVTQFHANLLYQKDINNEVQLSNQTSG